jgi:hypothetical protein
VEIFENSSWSCVHGIERWRSNCGCNSGGHPDWNQEWRAPLREALDGIRDELAAGFEERSRRLLKHPWAARDDYIEVLLDRSRESISRFFGKHAKRTLSREQETEALTLLEIQRHAMLMYTSCGWFFDEISGLETVQVLEYAGRALQLAGGLYDGRIEARFLKRLEACKSNLSDHKDGRSIYEKFVRPAMLDLRKFGAHYAVTSLFEPYEERARLYCYDVEREDSRSLRSGEARLAMGKVKITSAITLEEGTYGFGVLHLGDHNVSGGIREYRGEESYAALLKEIGEPFRRADLPETLRAVDRTFGAQTFSLKFLFRDHQRKILQALLQKSEGDAISAYRRVYDQNALLMRFLSDVGHPIPHPFLDAAERAIGTGLREAFGADAPDTERIEALLEEAAIFKIPLDEGGLAYTLAKNAERIALQFRAAPSELVRLQSLEAFVRMGQHLPFQVHFWKTQNVFHEMLQTVYPGFLQRAAEGDENAESWLRRFTELGERLSFRMKRD